jgi:asparagine synthase (glutamine-hydrolysing)
VGLACLACAQTTTMSNPSSSGAERYVVRATIDLAALRIAGTPSIAADGTRMRCEAAGLSVEWDARRATHATGEGALCIAWGAPRMSSATSNGVAGRVGASALLDPLRGDVGATLARLRGAFGVALIDARRGRVVLAVDRFSMETACHAFSGGILALSDRADAVPLPARTLSTQSLYDYLYFHCIPAPATIYREVSRLEPGTHLVATAAEERVARHWEPRFDAPRGADPRPLAAEFRGLVESAVANEAASGDVLGCFLSGGTDSSTVAGMLGRVSGAPARTYSIGFDARGYDEMAYARIAARHFGAQHHEYYVTADDIAQEAAAVAQAFDQPFGNSSALPAYLCARRAHDEGVTRMLAGDGGDELFGGNSRYRLQLALGLYEHLPRALRAHVLEPLLGGRAGRAAIPGLRHAAAYVRLSSTPMPERMETFNLLARVGAANVLDPDLLARVDEGAPMRAQRATWLRSTAPHLLDRILQYDWKYTLADNDLAKVRGATGLAGLTVGYPLLSDELVDFSLRLPARYKLRAGRLRWFFKYALRDFLPAEILAKKKHGFGLPFGVWAVEHPQVRALAADSLAGLEQRGILRRGFRDPLVRELLPAHPAYYGELIWILMMLEQWLAAHAGSKVTPALA